jgi:tight adherence protein B
MTAAVGAFVGLTVAIGVCLIVAGLRRQPVPAAASRRPVAWGGVVPRAGPVVVATAVGWAATGWPAAGVVAGAAAAIAPMLVAAQRARQLLNERSEALASWAEMLRDTIGAHAGLRQAIALSAPVAPLPIRSSVQVLAARLEHEPLGPSLRAFADDIADPVADLIVAALVIAAERQAQRLAELLSQIATAARQQSSMRLRVETGRARTYASSRALVVITFGLAVGLLLFSPEFMSPYDTITGQLVLIGIGGLFTAALGALVSMSRPAVVPRLLAGVEHEAPVSR